MASDSRIGTELAGYRIDSLLGRGGMSTVYLAEHLRLGRKVALKLLSPELAEHGGFRERFVRESRMAASLDHPNIVPIYDAGEVDDLLYIAMRYVEGTDLKTLIRDFGPLDPGRAAAFMSQSASALDVAHARGLVHRDVKPANMLLASMGPDLSSHLYLSDFGLTKQALSVSGLTGTGQLVGTIDYVAPEQIQGQPADGRADVYSLGCTLFECLTGETPFKRELEVAVLWAHVQEPSPSAVERRPELPRGIDEVIARAMAKSPDDRYSTAGGLAAAMRSELGMTTGDVSTYLTTSADRATAEAAPRPATEPRARRSRLPLVVGLAALVLAAAVGVFLLTRGGGGTTVLSTVPINRVGRIDAATNEILDALDAGAKPTGVAVDGGVLWVIRLDAEIVLRVDTATGRGEPTSTGGHPTSIAIDEDGTAWVLNGLPESQVVRVETRQGLPQIEGQAIVLPVGARDIAVGEGAVWVTNGIDGNLSRIDPATGSVDPRELGLPENVEPDPQGIAVGGGFLWVVNGEQVLRIDPSGAAPTGRASVLYPAQEIAFGEGFVWVTHLGDDQVSKIDPESLQAVSIPVGNGPVQIATGEGAVWVSNSLDGTVSRIDPQSPNTVTTIRVGNSPEGIAVGGGSVWVAVHAL